MITTPLRDIETEADIALFLDRFYARVRQNPDLGMVLMTYLFLIRYRQS